jgi:Arc/MetJ-type ribon-helix-helix transcriptional regulator
MHPTLGRMEVQFTPDQKAFVRQAIESGRLRGEEDAVKEALSLWEERERRRLEILVAVDAAETSLARGEGRRVRSLAEAKKLADEVKQRGLARLNADQNSHS